MKSNSYQDLVVWQKSMDLTRQIYLSTQSLPDYEKYGLCSQMQRAAVAIPSNIAEGQSRHHRKEFHQFIGIALGSVAELETQLLLCQSIHNLPINNIMPLVSEVKKMLYSLSSKLHVASD